MTCTRLGLAVIVCSDLIAVAPVHRNEEVFNRVSMWNLYIFSLECVSRHGVVESIKGELMRSSVVSRMEEVVQIYSIVASKLEWHSSSCNVRIFRMKTARD